jgi:hypothetical protein
MIARRSRLWKAVVEKKQARTVADKANFQLRPRSVP